MTQTLYSRNLLYDLIVSSINRRKEKKPPEQVNYTLANPGKITFEFLKSHLWSAADILRGSLDPSDYRQPIMTILFLKREC
jgi:hypothetical protein